VTESIGRERRERYRRCSICARDVVNGINVKLVGLEVPLGSVDGNRPEAVDRHIFDVKLVDGRAVVLARPTRRNRGITILDVA
jgi:hypothetical protein